MGIILDRSTHWIIKSH